MAEPAVRGIEDSPPLEVQLAFQRGRLAVYVVFYLAGLLGHATGTFEPSLVSATLLFLTSAGSWAVFAYLLRRQAARGGRLPLELGWMACDVVFVCWLIGVAGDPWGLWLIMLLTNVAAAAFMVGGRAALAVAAANSLGYLVLLAVMGELDDPATALVRAAGKLLLLWAPSYLFLRGIADLREKRLRVRELLAEKEARLAELARLHADLDRRSQELADANVKSQDASRAKSQFLANMSHELRTPLNSIIGFTEILVERTAPGLEPRYARFLENVLKSGRHLLSLINAILDLSKIEAGRMELTLDRLSLRDLLDGVRGVMLGFVGERGIAIDVETAEGLPSIVGDGPKLKQILYNLASNAVKFSPDGGRVVIRARQVDTGASPLGVPSVQIAVEDGGIGVAREDQERIFEEFTQLDAATTRAYGGTGLGLAIVRRFTELHGGRVDVDSAPEKGSVFTVTLPIDASQLRIASGSPAAIAFNDPATGDVAPGPLVLVVEDDDDFSRALAADLLAAGYRPRRARRGEEALLKARKERPALITLDLALPGLDGWEVLKELKSDPVTAEIPVVIVTLSGDHELGFALGAEEVMVKPVDRARFLTRLEELAPKKEASQAVLLIDDDPTIHDLVGDLLTRAGYEVLVARGGEEGLAIAAREQPALVVLDLMMPGMSGFEVAVRLREEPATAAIPVVVLTAKDLTAEDRTRLSGKIQGLLNKAPLDRRRILDTIREVEARRGRGGARG